MSYYFSKKLQEIRSEKINLEKGYSLSSLAPWVYLKDAWQIQGDFSLPVIVDRGKYDLLKNNLDSKTKDFALIHK
jgi:hypothetical protein